MRNSQMSFLNSLPLLLSPANKVWGKVMFLLMSVILFTVGRGSLSREFPDRSPRHNPSPDRDPQTETPWTESPLHSRVGSGILLECFLILYFKFKKACATKN